MAQITIDQALVMAVEHHRGGRLPEAEGIYRQILAQQPSNPAALHFLGVLAGQVGKIDAAIDLIKRAIAINSNDPVCYNNLANCLMNKGQVEEAIAAYRQALRLRPDYAEAFNNLGGALYAQGKFEESADSYKQALRLRPDYAEGHHNLGAIQHRLGKLDEAIASCRRSLELDPNYIPAYMRLGSVLVEAGQLEEAMACSRRAIALQPENAQFHSNFLLALNYNEGSDRQTLFTEARRWAERHADPLAKFIRPHANDRSPERPLRIGYVSADFRIHASAMFLMPLLQNHDRNQFKVVVYSEVKWPDEMTRKFQGHADLWRNTLGVSDERMADMVREDGIDILVDLKLHTDQNRLLVFARKPAPVQVTWLGYPGTTGMKAMDYRLTDPYLDSLQENDAFYAEKSIRLPDTFWCYDPLAAEPAVNPLPAKTNGYITFGSLNTFCKINDRVIQLWAEVLKGAANSRLLLLGTEGSVTERMKSVLERHEISRNRIEFITRRPRLNYLQLYHRMDIGLDTFPCSGHTTTLDALWMGVPVITFTGPTAMGRAGVCHLMNLGLPEFIAETNEQYIRKVVELATDLPRLTELRSTLRARMQASPLMDGGRFARNVETVYRQIWKKWCAAS